MFNAHPRRKISSKTRDHREEQKHGCGDEEPQRLLQTLKISAVSKDDANRNGERDEIESGAEDWKKYETFVQQRGAELIRSRELRILIKCEQCCANNSTNDSQRD